MEAKPSKSIQAPPPNGEGQPQKEPGEQMIIRRTFGATQHPKGSAERKRLNQNPVTSERFPRLPYVLTTTRWGSQLFATLAEAEEAQQLYQQSR